MSTKGDKRLKESLEGHIMTIHRHLEILNFALDNAGNVRLQRKLLGEIEHYTTELARVKYQLHALNRRLNED